ncbi:MAG: hypothetical protein CSA65_00935 [Proteobacteria bacterium]|nr:MAG: hypothetical protein CSA65_00935 [Pseudomonadota bacterium]
MAHSNYSTKLAIRCASLALWFAAATSVGCTKKGEPAGAKGSAAGSATFKSAATPKPHRKTARARPRQLVIKPTAPPPTAKDLLGLLGAGHRASKVGKAGKAAPSVSLLRRPTAVGGARYIVIVGSPGAQAKDGSRGLIMEAVVVQKVAKGWALVARVPLPTEGAKVPAAVAKAGVRDHRRVRAGLRVRDADADGKAEAVIRYRYPSAGDILEVYALINLNEKPTLAFQTIFAHLDPKDGRRKQGSRISYADPDGDGRLELRVMTSGGGARMTAVYDHDPKTDRFVLRAPRAKTQQKR